MEQEKSKPTLLEHLENSTKKIANWPEWQRNIVQQKLQNSSRSIPTAN
jgi:hypothetical protein